MPAKEKAPGIAVRVRTTSDPPQVASAIIAKLAAECTSAGRCWLYFAFDGLPKSVNHMYIHTRTGTRLRPEVHAFRATVKQAMGEKLSKWKPTGVSSAVILMQSPYWVTKERKIRKMDADNRVKPIFDAIEQATGQEDERHWSFHVFKVPAKHERIVIYLFDLGDVVDYYY